MGGVHLDLISAGIVLVSVDAINTEFDGVGSNELDRAWERCLQTLLRMVDVYPSARDYAVALNGLKQRGSSTQPGRHPPIFSRANMYADIWTKTRRTWRWKKRFPCSRTHWIRQHSGFDLAGEYATGCSNRHFRHQLQQRGVIYWF